LKVLIGPDSFKGSMTALQAAQAIATGLQSALPDVQVDLLPLSDGGDGLTEVLAYGTGGRLVEATVTGPLGDQVKTHFGLLGDGETAVVEVAAASGLILVPASQRNPERTTSFGTGELVRLALDAGSRRLILGLGGSATNDGGMGMLAALGVRFLDAKGQPVAPTGGNLIRIERADAAGLDPRLGQVEVLVATDVRNPLLGPTGATYMYGPQKGATEAALRQLEAGMAQYAGVVETVTGVKVTDAPGAGAAGGIGAALLAFLGATLTPGIDLVLQWLSADQRFVAADVVITGEGRFDRQTRFGKVPTGVASLARRHDRPVIFFTGWLDEDTDEAGFAAVVPILPRPMGLEESMNNGFGLLVEASARIGRLLCLGSSLNIK
jgi:glycerate kinase